MKIWSPLFCKNLGAHYDEVFKLAQLIKTNTSILFDLRETFKGMKSDNGFSLGLAEYNWLKKVLKADDTMTHTLEHNKRIINIDKTTKDVLITVHKSNGQIKKLLVKEDEVKKLITFLEETEEPLNKLITCSGQSMDFSQKSFYRITMN